MIIIAPGEARTHDLRIMRPTRCLLRYRGDDIVACTCVTFVAGVAFIRHGQTCVTCLNSSTTVKDIKRNISFIFFQLTSLTQSTDNFFTTFWTLSTSHSATIWRTASTNNKNIRKLMLRIWLLGTTRAFLHYRLRPLEMKNGSQLRLQSASVYDVTWLIVRKKKMPCHYWRSDVEEDQWKAPLSMKIKNEIIVFLSTFYL